MCVLKNHPVYNGNYFPKLGLSRYLFVSVSSHTKGQMIAQNGFNQDAKMMTISELYPKDKLEGKSVLMLF